MRYRTALVLAGLVAGYSGGALAQASGKVPIEHDLRRWDRLEDRIDANGTGSIAPYPRLGDPSGVPGFTGPPGIVGDSVNSYSPLPPGAPGNEDW